MSIQFAILGLLSWQPLSGYDLKKIFADSTTLYWSGNNNQIYRSLVQLHDDALVTKAVEHQESSPSRKVYSITDKGRVKLRDWVMTTPELPDLRHSFLIQLEWANQLSDDELDGLLANYEDEVHMQMLMIEERYKRNHHPQPRTAREALIWRAIHQNRVRFYQNELDWVRELRKALRQPT
jgi:DNA-binding PadR family transcriptional regulator